tara:strand:+ start:378 stop:485 length:108 start_codon:yes stop_codon:yes gene_type:complete
MAKEIKFFDISDANVALQTHKAGVRAFAEDSAIRS